MDMQPTNDGPTRVERIAQGEQAPDFELKNQHGQPVRLSSFRGNKAVLLVFYPFAFSGICGGELHALRDRLDEIVTDGVELLVVSVDSMYSQRVFAEREGFTYPMLSDYWPHGGVAADYGVLHTGAGAALRATFLIDRDGVVRWSVVEGIGKARDVDDYVEALAGLDAPAGL